MVLNKLLLGLIVLFVFVFGQVESITAQSGNSPTAYDMEAALNEWRLQAGLSPLKANPTLEALAQLQLDYILQLPNLPTRIHDGILHERPRVRALWEPYEWPYYGIIARVNLEEITVAQKTVRQGISWWQHSAIHKKAATNPNYREMGVAAAPYPNGTVFVAVLAGRPDVFPALIHPDGDTLYLTRETYSGAMQQHMSNITQVRLLDGDQNPLTSWQAWQETLSLEGIDLPVFYVEYSDGKRSVITEIDRERDVFPLPGYDNLRDMEAMDIVDLAPPDKVNIEIIAETDEMFALRVDNPVPIYLSDFEFYALELESGSPSTSFVEQIGTPYAGEHACFIFLVSDAPLTIPEACSGQIVLNHVLPIERFWYDSIREAPVRLFVLSTRGQMLADCRLQVVGCTFEVAAASPEAGAVMQAIESKRIRLVYTPDSFALVNESSKTINASRLVMSDGEKTFSTGVWNESGFVWQLPAGDCLQVAINGTHSPRKPSSCTLRHGWVSVRSSVQFWTSGSFEVSMNNNVLATCDSDAGECVIDLP